MEEKILLRDLLKIDDNEIEKCKIRFIVNNESTNVIDLFLNYPDEINIHWLFWNYSKSAEFKEGQTVIGLVRMNMN